MEDLDARRTVVPRRAGPDNAVDLAALWWRSRQASIPSIPPPVHTADEVRAWFAEVVVPGREVWLIGEEGAAAALLVLDGGWIDQLYVEPERVGTGLGARLVALAKHLRPGGLELDTFQSNRGAQRFYLRHGFVVSGTVDDDNEEGAPALRLRWTPPGPPAAGTTRAG